MFIPIDNLSTALILLASACGTSHLLRRVCRKFPSAAFGVLGRALIGQWQANSLFGMAAVRAARPEITSLNNNQSTVDPLSVICRSRDCHKSTSLLLPHDRMNWPTSSRFRSSVAEKVNQTRVEFMFPRSVDSIGWQCRLTQVILRP
jgi:hypothetical protein